MAIFYYKNYFSSIKSKEAPLRRALVSYEGLTNSIRPLNRHGQEEVISPAGHAQKRNAEINVELGDGEEVFGQHGAGVAHRGELLQRGIPFAQ